MNSQLPTDVVTINAPLHPETEGLFNDKLIGKMKRGSYLVNTARGKIVDRDAAEDVTGVLEAVQVIRVLVGDHHHVQVLISGGRDVARRLVMESA